MNLTVNVSSLWLRPCWKKSGLSLERNKRLKIDKSQQNKKIRVLRVSGFWCKKPEDSKLNRILFSKCKIADCDPHEGNQNCSYGETSFRNSRWIIFSNNVLESLDHQDFDPRININGSSIESSCTRKRFFNWDFDWWPQTGSCWENSVWIMTNTKSDGIFQDFRTMGMVTKDTKQPIIQSSTLLQVERLWLRPK